jgi:hypothetical protein
MSDAPWAARLATLATGHGGAPEPGDWILVIVALVAIAVLGTWLLRAAGLTKLESITVAGVAPLLVLVDAPLGNVSPGVSLAANLAGCVVPLAVGLKILLDRRIPGAEVTLVIGVGILVAFVSSRVVVDRGILLQYRVPALVIGVLAAGLLYRRPEVSGAAGFVGGAVGVVLGADVMHLRALADAGGAGLLDGIFLVALLAALVGEATAILLRAMLQAKTRARSAA